MILFGDLSFRLLSSSHSVLGSSFPWKKEAHKSQVLKTSTDRPWLTHFLPSSSSYIGYYTWRKKVRNEQHELQTYIFASDLFVVVLEHEHDADEDDFCPFQSDENEWACFDIEILTWEEVKRTWRWRRWALLFINEPIYEADMGKAISRICST